MLQYKDYIGHVVFDDLNELFFGEVINIKGVITFQAATARDLKQSFVAAIDGYLEQCDELCIEPEMPFSGRLTFNISPELHRDVSIAAQQSGETLSVWICNALRHVLCRH
jgi:predicted HicB family RNase H-like nuclease